MAICINCYILAKQQLKMCINNSIQLSIYDSKLAAALCRKSGTVPENFKSCVCVSDMCGQIRQSYECEGNEWKF